MNSRPRRNRPKTRIIYVPVPIKPKPEPKCPLCKNSKQSLIFKFPRWSLVMIWILMVAFQLYSYVATASPPVTLTVSQRFGYAPLTVSGKIYIQPNDENRGYCLHWESEEGQSGLSCKPLEGASSPKTFFYEIKALPPGHYGFMAVLLRPSGYIESPPTAVQVLSHFE